jgi:uncharacterized membrane protein
METARIKFVDAIALAISLIPLMIWLFLPHSAAEQIPIHWNTSGEVDGWATGKQIPIFLGAIAAGGFVVYLILRFLRKVDPKPTAQLNDTTAMKIGLGVIILMAAINIIVILPGTPKSDISTIVLLFVSLLFSFLGNVMYNIKPNYFIGIRLPWTLEDENNWRETHRLAGVIWFVGGMVSAILCLILSPKVMFPTFIGITIILVLIPSIYSFIYFRRTRHGQ